MASYTKVLKEANGDIVYPQTLASAVITTGGYDLDTAIASKADASAVNGKINVGNVTASDLTASVFSAIYPVGSIYMSTTMTSASQVASAFGGTWVAWGAGRVPVGVNTSDSDFDTAEETGGEKTHVLSGAEMPQHTHSLKIRYDSGSVRHDYAVNYTASACNGWADSGLIYNAGNSQAHNNLQPYITCYMYKRTA